MKKLTFLHFTVAVLFTAGVMDLIRGYMHTFQVPYAAVNMAGIGADPDGMFLLGAFGISNFLTASLYFLIIWKAKYLVPYVLLLIPVSYFLGGAGIAYANIQPEAPFLGQYMMRIYLIICLVASVSYFFSTLFNRNKTIKSEMAHS